MWTTVEQGRLGQGVTTGTPDQVSMADAGVLNWVDATWRCHLMKGAFPESGPL